MGDAFTLCKLHSSSGALPVNDADERLLVDPDLRSHAEERPDPKTNLDPESESCARARVARHPVGGVVPRGTRGVSKFSLP